MFRETHIRPMPSAGMTFLPVCKCHRDNGVEGVEAVPGWSARLHAPHCPDTARQLRTTKSPKPSHLSSNGHRFPVILIPTLGVPNESMTRRRSAVAFLQGNSGPVTERCADVSD